MFFRKIDKRRLIDASCDKFVSIWSEFTKLKKQFPATHLFFLSKSHSHINNDSAMTFRQQSFCLQTFCLQLVHLQSFGRLSFLLHYAVIWSTAILSAVLFMTAILSTVILLNDILSTVISWTAILSTVV